MIQELLTELILPGIFFLIAYVVQKYKLYSSCK
jgi:hypothetical protein